MFALDQVGPVVVRVCADTAGTPNLASCQTFTISASTDPMSGDFTDVTTSFTGTCNADANALVWVSPSSSGSGYLGWEAASEGTSTSTHRSSPDNGGTWYWHNNLAVLFSISGIPTTGPTASAVTITGTPQVGGTLTGSYTYASASDAVQGNTTMRWMVGAQADGGNYLFYCVTPVAQTGVLTGPETCSSGSQFVFVFNITTPTTVTGIGPNQVTPLDLRTGYGPSLTQCLLDTIRQLLGSDTVYLVQVSGGGTRVQQGGKVIRYYVVRAGGDASQGSGFRLLQSNAMTVGTSCGNLDVTPALYNLTEFGAALTAAGRSASINATGVITITGNGSVYVARPDYFVTPGQAEGPSLKQGSDGQYRFTDSAHNSQGLRAAFLSPDARQTGAGAALGGIPASSATANWWADGPNDYRYPIGFASQGVTQTTK